MKTLRNWLRQFSREAQYERLQREMTEFLSQARDHRELEHLEREWDRRYLARMQGLSSGRIR